MHGNLLEIIPLSISFSKESSDYSACRFQKAFPEKEIDLVYARLFKELSDYIYWENSLTVFFSFSWCHKSIHATPLWSTSVLNH